MLCIIDLNNWTTRELSSWYHKQRVYVNASGTAIRRCVRVLTARRHHSPPLGRHAIAMPHDRHGAAIAVAPSLTRGSAPCCKHNA